MGKTLEWRSGMKPKKAKTKKEQLENLALEFKIIQDQIKESGDYSYLAPKLRDAVKKQDEKKRDEIVRKYMKLKKVV